MGEIATTFVESPLGWVEIRGSTTAVHSLYFVEARDEAAQSNSYLEMAAEQVAAYFAGDRTGFDLNLQPEGTPFQQAVWRQLCRVGYGELSSYQAIADALEKPTATRAVGAANGQNPISVIIPCHRIIGANGKLVGYGGGIWRKEWLLRHEGALLL